MTRLVLLPALLLALAACGDDASDAPDDVAAPATPTTSVTVTATVAGAETRSVLECGPPGGTHPSPDAACTALRAAGAALAPPPADRICTELYGGPEVARVVGTVEGAPVDRAFARSDGCAISDWDAMGAVLPEPAGP